MAAEFADRVMYSVTEAARILGLPRSTVVGRLTRMRQGVSSPSVTWGEFIELARSAGAEQWRFVWNDDGSEVVSYLPDVPGSPVTMHPDHVFGIPSVRWIRTEVLAERALAGDGDEGVAADYEDYGMTKTDVRHAIRFELTLELPCKAR